MEMDCPRCHYRGGWNDRLSLEFTKHTPLVRKLTIGSIRYDSADDEPVSYMCVETGVGSGSVYRERDLHEDEATAARVAEFKCAELQSAQDATPEAMTQAERSRMGSFDALRKALTSDIERGVRESLKSEIDEYIQIGEFTPGEWIATGGTNDDGVFSFDVRAVDPISDSYGLSVVSGYGGLSSCFASKDQGPANALLIAAAPRLLRIAQMAATLDAPIAEQARAAIAKATGEA